MAARPNTCTDCPSPLGRENKSGRCRSCMARSLNANPDFQAKRRAGIRRKIAANPEYREALANRARVIGKLPQAIEGRRRHCIEARIWERGNAVQPAGCAARMKAGARGSATKLAWCPSHLRETYRDVAKTVGAVEARRLVLEMAETQDRRFVASARREQLTIASRHMGEAAAVPSGKTKADVPLVFAPAPSLANVFEPLAAIAEIGGAFGFTLEQMTGPSRVRALNEVRKLAAALLFERRPDNTYEKVGRWLSRDHSTMIHAIQTLPDVMKRRPAIAAAYAHFRREWGLA